jgi:hypothetical protein
MRFPLHLRSPASGPNGFPFVSCPIGCSRYRLGSVLHWLWRGHACRHHEPWAAQHPFNDHCGATAVIDGATPRPVTLPIDINSSYDLKELTWGRDDTTLYAQGADDLSREPIYSLTVSSAGLTFYQSDDRTSILATVRISMLRLV